MQLTRFFFLQLLCFAENPITIVSEKHSFPALQISTPLYYIHSNNPIFGRGVYISLSLSLSVSLYLPLSPSLSLSLSPSVSPPFSRGRRGDIPFSLFSCCGSPALSGEVLSVAVGLLLAAFDTYATASHVPHQVWTPIVIAAVC